MFKRDTLRLVALFVLGIILTQADISLTAVAFSAGVVLILAALSHVIRRVLFPRLDLQELGLKAMESPVGAGLAFGSIVFLLGVFVQSGVALMR